MIEFYLGSALLLALAAWFVLRPQRFLRRHQLPAQSAGNRAWYAQRVSELGPDEQPLLDDVQLRVLQDADPQGAPQTVGAAAAGWRGWLLLPLLVLVAGLYRQLGAATDVALARSLDSYSEVSSRADYDSLLQRLQVRAGQRPDNLHYQFLLGRFYLDGGDYERALAHFLALAAKAPDAGSAQAFTAMAERVVARADQHAAPLADVPDSPGVTLSISLPPGAEVAPTDTVYVFARNPRGASRMPVAVRRLRAAQLPAVLRLDDSAAMAGQTISQLPEVVVVARVSPSGRPGERYATYQGSLEGLSPDRSGHRHALQLAPH